MLANPFYWISSILFPFFHYFRQLSISDLSSLFQVLSQLEGPFNVLNRECQQTLQFGLFILFLQTLLIFSHPWIYLFRICPMHLIPSSEPLLVMSYPITLCFHYHFHLFYHHRSLFHLCPYDLLSVSVLLPLHTHQWHQQDQAHHRNHYRHIYLHF